MYLASTDPLVLRQADPPPRQSRTTAAQALQPNSAAQIPNLCSPSRALSHAASTYGNFISSRDLQPIAGPATIGTGPIDHALLRTCRATNRAARGDGLRDFVLR